MSDIETKPFAKQQYEMEFGNFLTEVPHPLPGIKKVRPHIELMLDNQAIWYEHTDTFNSCTCIGPESMLTLTYGVVLSLKKWGQLHLHLSFSLGIGFIVENISLH